MKSLKVRTIPYSFQHPHRGAQSLAHSRSNLPAWWMDVYYNLRGQSKDQCEISVKRTLRQYWQLIEGYPKQCCIAIWDQNLGLECLGLSFTCASCCLSSGRLLHLWTSVSSPLKRRWYRQQFSTVVCRCLGIDLFWDLAIFGYTDFNYHGISFHWLWPFYEMHAFVYTSQMKIIPKQSMWGW